MPRVKLTIEYDGRPFVGWQRQTNGPSVQAALEDALSAYCQAPVTTVCAGRTDAGVHAYGQVVHADLPRADAADVVRDATNAHLRPAPVSVVDARHVPDTFDARRSALRRHYAFRILNRRAPPALDEGRVWWVSKPLDAAAMSAAAQVLVGHHDFSSFRASECQALSPVKTLDRLDVTRDGDVIAVRASARSFLHHMVRNLVGTLRWVGEGRWTADDVAAALAARDRAAAGPTAPPGGLYFLAVDYPEAVETAGGSEGEHHPLPDVL